MSTSLLSHFTFCECVLVLVCRQLGIGNFEPLKPYMLEVYTGALAVVPTLPGTAVVPLPLEHAASGAVEERKPSNAPALVRPSSPVLSAVARQTSHRCAR